MSCCATPQLTHTLVWTPSSRPQSSLGPNLARRSLCRSFLAPAPPGGGHPRYVGRPVAGTHPEPGMVAWSGLPSRRPSSTHTPHSSTYINLSYWQDEARSRGHAAFFASISALRGQTRAPSCRQASLTLCGGDAHSGEGAKIPAHRPPCVLRVLSMVLRRSVLHYNRIVAMSVVCPC